MEDFAVFVGGEGGMWKIKCRKKYGQLKDMANDSGFSRTRKSKKQLIYLYIYRRMSVSLSLSLSLCLSLSVCNGVAGQTVGPILTKFACGALF